MGLKIIRLDIQNFLGIKAVEIEPDGNVVVVSGKNGAGKSSVLNAIFTALTGKMPEKPIRAGTKKATITVDTEKLLITKTVSKKKTGGYSTQLTITNADGHPVSKPQQTLNQYLGALMFDPLEFSRMNGKDQLALLKELAGLDFEEQDAQRQELYDARTLKGRELRTIKGEFDALDQDRAEFKDAPAAPVDVAGLMAKLKEINGAIDKENETKAGLERKRANIERYQTEIEKFQAEIERLTADVEEYTGHISAGLEEIAGIEAQLKAAPTADDLRQERETVEAEINNVDEVNLAVRRKQEHARAKARLDAAQAEYDGYTDQIEEIDEAKATAIQSAKMPVDGLCLDDDGVSYDSGDGRGPIPFGQINDAQKLRVSVAMAMALNPDIRIIRIENGSLLDSDSMAVLDEMAGSQDYQVWIERVDESGKVGVVIEDGERTA